MIIPHHLPVPGNLLLAPAYGTGRASLLSGVVHLILLATWRFLILGP